MKEVNTVGFRLGITLFWNFAPVFPFEQFFIFLYYWFTGFFYAKRIYLAKWEVFRDVTAKLVVKLFVIFRRRYAHLSYVRLFKRRKKRKNRIRRTRAIERQFFIHLRQARIVSVFNFQKSLSFLSFLAATRSLCIRKAMLRRLFFRRRLVLLSDGWSNFMRRKILRLRRRTFPRRRLRLRRRMLKHMRVFLYFSLLTKYISNKRRLFRHYRRHRILNLRKSSARLTFIKRRMKFFRRYLFFNKLNDFVLVHRFYSSRKKSVAKRRFIRFSRRLPALPLLKPKIKFKRAFAIRRLRRSAKSFFLAYPSKLKLSKLSRGRGRYRRFYFRLRLRKAKKRRRFVLFSREFLLQIRCKISRVLYIRRFHKKFLNYARLQARSRFENRGAYGLLRRRHLFFRRSFSLIRSIDQHLALVNARKRFRPRYFWRKRRRLVLFNRKSLKAGFSGRLSFSRSYRVLSPFRFGFFSLNPGISRVLNRLLKKFFIHPRFFKRTPFMRVLRFWFWRIRFMRFWSFLKSFLFFFSREVVDLIVYNLFDLHRSTFYNYIRVIIRALRRRSGSTRGKPQPPIPLDPEIFYSACLNVNNAMMGKILRLRGFKDFCWVMAASAFYKETFIVRQWLRYYVELSKKHNLYVKHRRIFYMIANAYLSLQENASFIRGFRILVRGKIGGSTRSRVWSFGRSLPLQQLRFQSHYGMYHIRTFSGILGFHFWLF